MFRAPQLERVRGMQLKLFDRDGEYYEKSENGNTGQQGPPGTPGRI
jgi:hypothetical protein